MSKVKVPVIGSVMKSVAIETDAPSRAEMTAAITAAVAANNSGAGPSKNAYPTLWRLIREIPANIVRLAAQSGAGLMTRLGSGQYTVRTLTAGTGIDVTNGDGGAGNPTVTLDAVLDDLADVVSTVPDVGEVLTYLGTAGWGPAAPGSGSGDSLEYQNTFIPTGNTIGDTSVETAFISSYAVPPDALLEGSRVGIKIWGTYNTDSSAGTLRLRVKLDGSTVLDSGAITLTNSITDGGWSLEAAIAVFEDGAAGDFDIQGRWELESGASSAQIVALKNTSSFVYDTTIDLPITVTVEFGTSDPDNEIVLRQMAVWVEFADPENENPPTDPNFANVVALLHFDGANASTTLTDVIAGHTWTCNGTGTELATAEKRFGPSSVRLPGSGTPYVLGAASTDFGLGTGDYTIEFWCRPDASGGTQFIFDMRAFGSGAGPGPIICGISGGWNIFLNGGFQISGGSLVATTWAHIALTRNSATTRFFVNGIQTGSNYTDSANYGSSQNVVLGRPADSNSLLFTGYIDDLRITRGVARYTSNFTPPSLPFPNS